MQLLRTTVRGNWQDIAHNQTSENASLWRTIQVVTILSVLAVLLLSLAAIPWPWQDFLRSAASFSVFCILPLWHVYRQQNHAKRLILLTSVLFLAIAAIGSFTRPVPMQMAAEGARSPWPVGLSVLALATSWLILAWSYRAFPSRMRQLGITPAGWILNLILGVAVGGILGFHLLLSADFLPGSNFLQIPAWPVAIWTICYYGGFQSMAEELLFRGLSLPILSEGLHHPIWKAAVHITFLNLLIYLGWVPYDRYTGVWFWLMAYRTVLYLANAFLRQRQKSILAGLTASVVFHLFVAAIVT
jgi:hypothetical protein